MDYAEHALRLIQLEQDWLELRGWITKNGRHILIGDDESTSGAARGSKKLYSNGGAKPKKCVDKAEKSGIIKTDERFDLDPNKINKFLLLPGAKHSEEFFNVGYKPGDYELLFDDIAAGFDMKKAVDFRANPSGKEGFSIFMKLGVTKKRDFRTTWERKNSKSKPRFTSAYRNSPKKR